MTTKGGELMGTDMAVPGANVVSAERMEIRNRMEVLETVRPYAASELGRRIRVIWEGSEYRGRGRQTRPVAEPAARRARVSVHGRPQPTSMRHPTPFGLIAVHQHLVR